MWLDADDVLLPGDAAKLEQLKLDLDPDTDAVIMKYNLYNLKTNAVKCTFYRERLVRRDKNFKWHNPVHEYLNYSGKYLKADIAITHKKMQQPTPRNLEIYEKYIASGHELSNRDYFYYGKELFNLGRREEASQYYEQFIKTTGELVSSYTEAYMDLSTYYLSINEPQKSLHFLLQYLEKFQIRAEICCAIGYHYKHLQQYEEAISWFCLAPSALKPNSLGSVRFEYWDYIPYMELCACYYKKGDIDTAIIYNEKAAVASPNDTKVCHNRVFLGQIKEKLIQKIEN